jgi:hypothetical protein
MNYPIVSRFSERIPTSSGRKTPKRTMMHVSCTGGSPLLVDSWTASLFLFPRLTDQYIVSLTDILVGL